MSITLDDVVLEQMQTNETLGLIKEKTDITFSMQNEGIGILINQMQEFLQILKRNERLDAENQREQLPGATPPEPLPPPEPASPTPNRRDDTGAFGDVPILTLGTGLGALGLQAAMGYLSQWSSMVKAGFRTFGVDMQKGIDGISDIFGRARSFVTSAIQNVGTRFSNFFSPITQLFRGIGSQVGGITSQISDLMKPITDFFSRLANNPIVKVLGNIGKLLGRLAAPIFLALDIFGGVRDRLEKIDVGFNFATVDAIFGGVRDGLISFILTPIEILKKGISWLAGKLGFEQFESFLDSFNIVTVVQNGFNTVQDFILDLVGFVFDGITGAVNAAANAIPELFNSMQNFVSDGMKSLLRAVLPAPDFMKFELPGVDLGFTQFGGGEVNLNPIPNGLYEYAGLPTPTRSDESGVEAVVNRDGTIVAGDTLQRVTNNAVTNEIATQTIANTANSQSAPIVIQDNSVNSSQQSNVSNNTSAPAPMRSPVNNNRTRASAYAG